MWLSRGVEPGLEGRAGGAADEPVERTHVNQRDFHRRGAVVMFGEAQGLSVHCTDGAERDGDAVLERVLVHSGIDRALDAAAVPLGIGIFIQAVKFCLLRKVPAIIRKGESQYKSFTREM